jgi:hypothetical protein
VQGRFRILKLPIELHKKEDVDNVFFTCCAIHNHLHIFDGRDAWEAGVDWGPLGEGQFQDDEDPHWVRPHVTVRQGDQVVRRLVEPGEDFSKVGQIYFHANNQVILGGQPAGAALSPQAYVALHTERSDEFCALQQKLVQNYAMRRAEGSVYWLRSSLDPAIRANADSAFRCPCRKRVKPRRL